MGATPIVILKKRKEFLAVYDEGTRFAGHGFVLLRRTTGAAVTRFGITLTRKHGKAVMRNRLRRRVKAVLAEVVEEIAPGYDVVVIPRRGMGSAEFARVRSGLLWILARAELLSPRRADR
jgi:ribonuclease P protein component